MKREDFIEKYDGRVWGSEDDIRVYLSLEKAMPRRNISRAIKNSVKVWLDKDGKLEYKAPKSEIEYLAEVIADAETIED